MRRGIEIFVTMLGVSIMAAIVFVKAGSQTSGSASQSGGTQSAEILNAFGSTASNVIKSVEGG